MYGPHNLPTYYCAECDSEIVIDDEPPGLCYYTGTPHSTRYGNNGCDCGASSRTLCETCAAEDEHGWPLLHPLEDPNPERVLEARHERQEADFNERHPI